MSELDEVKRAEMVASLRKLAALLEKNLELPLPYLGKININAVDRDQLAKCAKALAPLKPKKEASEGYFELVVPFGESFELSVFVMRAQVCERRQVGTKTFTRQVPVTTREETVVEPVYEWTCPDSLLAPGVGK
jgi:hypothetical protein